VNPKHKGFYRWVGFEQFGDIKKYSSVEDAPAVLLKLDLNNLREEYRLGKATNWIISEIFANPPSEELMEKTLNIS
jgi:hypothetical protein